MEKISWYIWGFFMLWMMAKEYGSIEKTPVQLVMIICTIFICGAISGVKK